MTIVDKTSIRSLKVKFIATALGSTFLLGMGFVAILHHLIAKQEQAQLRVFGDQAKQLSSMIEQSFAAHYRDVQVMASNSILKTDNRAAVTRLLNQYVALYKIYPLLLVTDTKGHLIGANDHNADGDELEIDSLFEKNYVTEPWFKRALELNFTDAGPLRGTFFESLDIDPLVSKLLNSQQLSTGFTTAIRGSDGEVLGILSARASPAWFDDDFSTISDSLRRANLKDAQISLFSDSGQLLYEVSSSQSDRGVDFNRTLKYNIADSQSASLLKVFPGNSGSLYYSRPGSPLQIAGFSKLTGPQFIESIGWNVLINNNAGEVWGDFGQAKKLMIFIFTMAMWLALVLSYLLATRLTAKFTKLAIQLAKSSRKVSASSSHLTDWSSQLSKNSLSQMSALRETAAAIEGIGIIATQSAQNASKCHRVSETSQEAARNGHSAVQEMNAAIQDISISNAAIVDQVEDGNRQIAEIAKVIGEIGSKTKVINDIVLQTKLLSFNASVEAARAGEHGKGFAVVAEEVGHLAQMSGNAAKEISSILDSSVRKVEGIVEETRMKVNSLVSDGRQKVEVGALVAEKCGTSLMHITSCVQEVDELLNQMSSASKDQLQGIEEISRSVAKLSHLSEQSDSIAKEGGGSAQVLSSQATQLGEMIGTLFYSVTGKRSLRESVGMEAPMKLVSTHQPKRKEKSKPVKQVKKSAPVWENREEPTNPKGSLTAVGGARPIPSKDDPRFEDV